MSLNLTALYCAAFAGNVEVAQLLLDRGAEINTRGFDADTALMIATYKGHTNMVRLLLERGADIHATNENGKYRALTYATYLGHTDIVKLLLDHGADWSVVTKPLNNDKTALEIAQAHGYSAVIALLEKTRVAQQKASEAQVQQPGTSSAVSASVPASPSVPASMSVPASDVDAPLAARGTKPNRYAIVVGIESYRTKLPKADFAAHDAQTMKDYLTKGMGFSEENVALLVNENATRTDIEKYVEHWLPNRVEKDSTVFIYYSGHGAPNAKTGDAYLVPYDGDPAFVEATGYPLKRLYEQLGKLPAKEVVVLLDSCFSGAGGRSVIAKGMRPMVLSVENPVLAGGKTLVLAASKGDQVSSTYDQKGHGLLTYFFLKGLRGEADTNRDGSVDLAEVYDYLKPQVERTARREYNNDQQPQLIGSPSLPAKGVRLVEKAGSLKP
nr:ankyrin repeat domain-containing protein [Nitrospirota bacterium]